MNNFCQAEKTQTDLDRRLSVKQLMDIQLDLNDNLPMGAGWTGVLSEEHFFTAIIDELSELLGSGVSWKWWNNNVDPSSYDEHNIKIEVTDIVHFWLSINILRFFGSLEATDFSKNTENPFRVYDYAYVGTDKWMRNSGGALIQSPNVLNHENFIDVVKGMLFAEPCSWDVYSWVSPLDKLIGSVGMSSELFSAYYTAKSELNLARFRTEVEDGTYVKVEDGIEDNDQLKPLIDAFMADETMTLDQLRQNVFDTFYELVV